MASVHDLIASLQDITSTSFANEAECILLKDALFETLRRVQSPWEIVWEHIWVNGAPNASIKSIIDAEVSRSGRSVEDRPKHVQSWLILRGRMNYSSVSCLAFVILNT